MRKKPTEAKKKKELNCFLWQVAFMQHFLTYVPHHYSKNCLLPFPPQKKWKIETKFNFRRFIFNPFHCKQAILTKQNSPNRFWRNFGYFHQQGFISSFLPCFCQFKLLTRIGGIIVGKMMWSCAPFLVVVMNINEISFWCILSWLCNCSKSFLNASRRNL